MQTNYKIGEEGLRPWGKWQVVSMGKNYVVKKITVQPNASLSLQKHHYRAEHWLVAQGTALVTLDKQIFPLTAGHAVDIPKNTPHRLENKTSSPLEIIEIQMGKILNEEDIVRFRDSYGRQ